MKHILFIALLSSSLGCSKTKVKECEALVATAEKIQKCEKIPPESRKSIKDGVETIRSALKMLEDVGDEAPKEQLDMLAKTCQRQNDQIREMYEKVAPECLK